MRRPTSVLCSTITFCALSFVAGAQTAVQPPAGQVDSPSAVKAPLPPNLWVIPHAPDFGYRAPAELASYTMTIQNASESPITIDRVQGDCTCTSVEIIGEARVIEPAGTMDILINLEAPLETGPHTRLLNVYAVGNELPFRVPIYVDVGYPVRVNGDPSLAIVAEPIGVLRLDSISQKPFKVIAVQGQKPVFNGYDPAKDPPRTEYDIVWDWSLLPQSEYPRFLIIETDHPGAQFFEVPAMVDGHRQIRVTNAEWATSESLLNLGWKPADKPISTHVTFVGRPLIPGAKIRVTGTHPDLTVRVVGLRKPDRGPGMIAELEVAPAPGLRGFVSSEITFEMNEFRTSLDLYTRFLPPGQNAPESPR